MHKLSLGRPRGRRQITSTARGIDSESSKQLNFFATPLDILSMGPPGSDWRLAPEAAEDPAYTRHETYFFEDGNIMFLVETKTEAQTEEAGASAKAYAEAEAKAESGAKALADAKRAKNEATKKATAAKAKYKEAKAMVEKAKAKVEAESKAKADAEAHREAEAKAAVEDAKAASAATLVQCGPGEARPTEPEETAGNNDGQAKAIAGVPANVTDKAPNQAKGLPAEASAEKPEPTPAPLANAGRSTQPPAALQLTDTSANVAKSTQPAQAVPESQPANDNAPPSADASQPPRVPEKNGISAAADTVPAADQQVPPPAPKDEPAVLQTGGPASKPTLRFDHLRMESDASATSGSSPSTPADDITWSKVEDSEDGEQSGMKQLSKGQKKRLKLRQRKAQRGEENGSHTPSASGATTSRVVNVAAQGLKAPSVAAVDVPVEEGDGELVDSKVGNSGDEPVIVDSPPSTDEAKVSNGFFDDDDDDDGWL
ncbi:hypothetical protein BC834DRAFT_1034511 [Gloeopeniophorella convolvens]|nr:hypothetical protein BC834DRAFT_1034511 [Gloeopeniophorella convolvens]